jgi:F0F1-type ATP synthase delta subunit
MNIKQINNIVKSIVKHDELSENNFNWICSNFSIKELKIFKTLLYKEIKKNTVFVYYAGCINESDKLRIVNVFINHKVCFIRNDKKIIGGICVEYNYSIYDYTIATLITYIIEQIKSE